MNINKDQTSQVDKILYRFKSSKNINDLLQAFLMEVNIIGEAFNDLYNKRNLADAEGIQLDQIGKILKEPRQGRDDDEYRKYLYIRTFVNSVSGTIPEIEDVIDKTEDVSFIQVFNLYPASVYIYIKTKTIPDPSLVDLITEVLPAGVSLGYIGYESEEEDSDLLAFIPYDKVYKKDLFYLSNGETLMLSDQTDLVVNVPTDADYIEEAYLAEDPLYEDAVFSRPIETL